MVVDFRIYDTGSLPVRIRRVRKVSARSQLRWSQRSQSVSIVSGCASSVYFPYVTRCRTKISIAISKKSPTLEQHDNWRASTFSTGKLRSRHAIYYLAKTLFGATGQPNAAPPTNSEGPDSKWVKR
jgi:hypothetical protein